MRTITVSSDEDSDSSPSRTILGTARMLLARARAGLTDPYKPELHYMRGPGPACRAKYGEQGYRMLKHGIQSRR